MCATPLKLYLPADTILTTAVTSAATSRVAPHCDCEHDRAWEEATQC